MSCKVYSQNIIGMCLDEKISLHKNRLGLSGYLQTKKKNKYGISINYEFSKYKYPKNTTKYSVIANNYVKDFASSPPYSGKLGENISSVINGYSFEIYTEQRLNTFKASSLNLKVSVGYSILYDRYSSHYFDEIITNVFKFNAVSCNMYLGYLIWKKNIGIEPLLGIAYYYPLLPDDNRYFANSPFVGAEIEFGVSFYYQKRKNQL